MIKALKSTTALAMSLLLVLPSVPQAQQVRICDVDAEAVRFPCDWDGILLRNRAELDTEMRIRNGLEQRAPEVLDDIDASERQAAERRAREAEAARRAAAEHEAREKRRRAAEEARQRAAKEAERLYNEAEAARRAAAEYEAREKERRAAAEAQQRAAREAALRRAKAEEARRAAEEYEARKKRDEAARLAEEQAARDRAVRREAERQRWLAEREARLAEEREAARRAAEAAARGEQRGTLEREWVTEEDLRRSDEDFDTAVTGAGGQSSSGLSKFEKALLLGLGAVVVGSVLKNGEKVVSRSGDRVVVEDPNGDLRVLKDDNALLRRPGDQVATETFNDGSSRTIVSKPDGSRVITVRGRDGSVLRRVNVDPRGNEFVLIDDLSPTPQIAVQDLPSRAQRNGQALGLRGEDALRAALQAEQWAREGQRFSLRQIREVSQVRSLVPELELEAIRFRTGSSAIEPAQARSLTQIGTTLRRLIAQDPRTVILVEGHTDAVGDRTYNLALSDRRAETVALALTEYFDVPPENMVTQGYGESALKIPTLLSEPANRRAVVRNITTLLQPRR